MNLESRVIKVVEDNLEKKTTVTIDTDLRNGLGLDSFAMVIIVNALEDEFGITIEDRHYRDINNVSDIVKALKHYCPDLKES